MSSTINCIRCEEKATCFGGHVHAVDRKIIAGFCKQHFRSVPKVEGCKGCFGEWLDKMGEDTRFGQVCYITKDGIYPADE